MLLLTSDTLKFSVHFYILHECQPLLLEVEAQTKSQYLLLKFNCLNSANINVYMYLALTCWVI
jgi:hypothetical protein